MSPRARAFLTAVFVVAFLVTTPVVLLRTSGYRVNWKRQRVEKTGSIIVETVPSGARVLIDGKEAKRLTPLDVPRLLPAQYAVRIEKAGYLPWEKTLEVRSGETAFVNDLVLFRETLPRLALPGDVVSASWGPGAADVAFVRVQEGWKELALLENGKDEASVLARFAADKFAEEIMAWSPLGDALLFTGVRPNGATEILLLPLSVQRPPISLHDGFPSERLAARWADDGRSVLIVSSAGVFSADADGTVTPAAVMPDVMDATSENGTMYRVRSVRNEDGAITGAAVERSPAFGDEETIAGLPPGSYRFLQGNAGTLLVADERKDKLFVVPTNGSDPEPGAFDASDAAWSPKGDRLLAWNDFEVSVVDPSSRTRTVVTRLGTPIVGCAWHPRGNAVLYATANAVHAAELDDRGSRNVFDLVRFTSVGDLAVTPDGALRFVGAAGSQRGLFEREL